MSAYWITEVNAERGSEKAVLEVVAAHGAVAPVAVQAPDALLGKLLAWIEVFALVLAIQPELASLHWSMDCATVLRIELAAALLETLVDLFDDGL